VAVKRRVIWLSDEDWAGLGRRAAAQSLSRSAYVGAWISDAVAELEAQKKVAALRHELTGYVPEFRPVPKPTRRHK